MERTRPRVDDAHRINLAWLVKLRFGAVAGQALTITAVDRLMRIPLPRQSLAALVGIELVSNLACLVWARRASVVPEWAIALLMALDVLTLTGLLYLTGGPFNPFSFLYLVYIALSAVVLRERSTWALVLLSLGCFGALFADSVLLDVDRGAGPHVEHVHMHLQGMWVAFAVASAFIVYFVTRVRRALARREAELVAAESAASRAEKLASLATLAAGAAHELATPLATIALVARELERQLARPADGAPAAEGEAAGDVRLIREQVDRCKEILAQMAADAGESAGEAIVAVAIDEAVGASVARARAPVGVRVEVEPAARGRRVAVPPRAFARALAGLIDNAVAASAPDGAVDVVVGAADAALRVEVRDRGAGMAQEILSRAGEPFFTTREPGRGMGLGLFLARTLVERLGGELRLRSSPGRGTTATVLLPPAPAAQAAATIGRTAPA